MFRISSEIIQIIFKYLETTPKLIHAVRNQTYTIGNIPMSYRQINSLMDEKVIDDNRNDKSKWRKFSFTEVFYLMQIIELRSYGLTNKQLMQFKELFFSMYEELENKNQLTIGELTTIAVVLHHEMYTVIWNSGQTIITNNRDILNLLAVQDANLHSMLILDLNKIINTMFTTLNLKHMVQPNKKVSDLFLSYEEKIKKEQEIIRLLESGKYKKLTVKIKGKDEYLVYGEKNNISGKVSIEELKKVIEENEYSDIRLTKRDNKIVNVSSEEVIKI